jgi:hypothetical protein
MHRLKNKAFKTELILKIKVTLGCLKAGQQELHPSPLVLI